MISCNALFSFFKPSSNATAFPPHRLRRKPLTETPRHGEKFSTGTPTSSSASATHSNDTVATLPNPMRQNARPILGFDGFKSVIKYQEFMPDPSDITFRTSLSRRHQDTEKSSRPERRRPRRHQQLTPLTASTPAKPKRQNAGPILACAGFKRVISVINVKNLCLL